ncbi:U4/U6.U5 snRNP associated protein [Coniosporium tulheliwenetii]|uniref:U4/U6.U5 snRNP associated protein n=1 Tax=Coniosporium tulheliwenetii TaxID=3383036 RepID=A0ACC2YZS3_9PEZI|nr:U4/U6.U5 snRNP associated protein [Cladosporium sp. JES 115]
MADKTPAAPTANNPAATPPSAAPGTKPNTPPAPPRTTPLSRPKAARATKPPQPAKNAAETEARRQRLDVAAQVGKTMLVPAGSAVGKRGRGAGFYCEACDLTFKDNLQFVEHLNSRQHLVAVGQTGEVRRATVEEVRQTLRYLKRKREEESKEVVVDLGERLERRAEEEEKEREEKRRKRNERRRRGGGEAGIKLEDDVGDGVIR